MGEPIGELCEPRIEVELRTSPHAEQLERLVGDEDDRDEAVLCLENGEVVGELAGVGAAPWSLAAGLAILALHRLFDRPRTERQ